MKKTFVLFLIVCAAASLALGQKDQPKKPVEVPKKEVVKNDQAALESAKAAFAAHGGDKFKNMKTLVVKGAVDITTSAIAQAIPATFATVFSGDKYRIDLNNPFTPFQQVYDGEQTFSSLRGGFTLPPLNRLGLPLLQKMNEKDFVIASLPEDKKKRKGFRITSPEGFFTDFYLDEKTGQIKGYDSSYEINGRNVTTNVEIDKSRTVEGVVIPERYAQRFDMGEITAYADFKAKEILVNSEVSDSIFVLGK